MSPSEHKRYTSAAAPDAISPPLVTPALEDELASRFWKRLWLFAHRRLRDDAASEDVAQETLRRVVAALREGRVENVSALPAFVFQTARHICLQEFRSSGREARAMAQLHVEGDDRADDPLTSLITDERRAKVREALDRLDRRDRELLRMLYYERADSATVASRLALTPVALRVRKHRALQRLAELLDGRARRK